MNATARLAELRAEARYAGERLALYRRRVLTGRGDARTLAERERAATGATDRLERAEHEKDRMGRA
jgi:hypothetical protein